MTPNKTLLTAINRSVQHWRRLSTGKRRVSKTNVYLDEGIGTDDCALCGLFFDHGCYGCPVAEKSGESTCKNTPYGKCQHELEEHNRNFNHPAFKAAAKKMLNFLLEIQRDLVSRSRHIDQDKRTRNMTQPKPSSKR